MIPLNWAIVMKPWVKDKIRQTINYCVCLRDLLDFNSILKAAPLKLGAVVINPDSFLAYQAWVASNESLGGVHFELFVYLPQAS